MDIYGNWNTVRISGDKPSGNGIMSITEYIQYIIYLNYSSLAV